MSDEPMERLVRSLKDDLDAAVAERDRLGAVVDALTDFLVLRGNADFPATDEQQGDMMRAWRRMLELQDQLDVSANIGGHEAQQVGQRFRSNACIHEEHEQCEKACPFCDDSCACACHPWNMRFDGDESSAGALPCHHCGAGVKGCLEADQPCCPDCHHGGAIRHRAFSAGGAS